MNQKEFLLELSQLCNIKKPVFLNTTDTWEFKDKSLCTADQLTVSPVIGRRKLTLENSDVTEIWMDVDGEPYKELKSLAVSTHETLVAFDVPLDCIFIKSSGRGFHFHVFAKGIRGEVQYKQIIDAISKKLPKSVAHSLGIDPRSRVETTRIREFGAKNGDHYCSLVSLKQLKKKRSYPTVKKPEDVMYPKIKVFQTTPQFIRKIREVETEEITQPLGTDANPLNFERFGNIQNLYECPLIKKLSKKSGTEHHLTHSERLFILQEFSYFGDEGRREVHKIICNCTDYDEPYTQKMIYDLMRKGRKPITCEWARKMIGCPVGCKGSGGRSPISFATKIDLEILHGIIDQEISLTTETGMKDYELVDIHLITLLDTFWGGDKMWTFSVAPSGSAKSLLIKSLSWNTYPLDSFTDKTFVSGLVRKTKDGHTEAIAGIADKLHGKTMTVEDMSALLSKRSQTRDEIFGFLRNVYKGELSIGTGTLRDAQRKACNFGLLIGVTPILDIYMALLGQLGERFLKVRHCIDEDLSAQKAIEKTLKGKGATEESFKKVQRAIYTFMSKLDLTRKIEFSKEVKDVVKKLAFYTSRARTSLMSDKQGGFVGYTEYYTRLAVQFTRALIFLCWIRNHSTPTEEDLRTIARLAFDTPQARRTILLKAMLEKEPLSLSEAARLMKSSDYKTDRAFRELEWVGIVEQDIVNSEWRIKPEWRQLIRFVVAEGSRGWTQHLLERDCSIINKATRHSPKPRDTLEDWHY